MRSVAEEADGAGSEVQVVCAGDVEDVHEEVEVMTLAFQCEVLDDAQVEIAEGRLPKDVTRSHKSVEYSPVIPVVGVVLRVEADDRCVGHAGMRGEERVQLESDRQVEDGVQVEDPALIE